MLPSPRELISLVHRRIHSPSLPDLLVPSRVSQSDVSSESINSVQFPPASRPSLGSLDLASPPAKAALPLTPPLTPASTKAADSDASDARSSRSNSFDVVPFNPYTHGYCQVSQWSPSDAAIVMHNSPKSDADLFRNVALPDPSVLPSPTSPTHPKHSPAQRASELDNEIDTQPASRFLFISGVPKSANSHTLKQAFVSCGDLKGIFVRFQAEHGAIILAFSDIRHTIRAHRQISTHTFFPGACLVPRFISPSELRNLIGQSNFVNQNDGDLFVATAFVGPDDELDAAALQNLLASFGDLRSFRLADSGATAFHVEYFDARDAFSALNALHGRIILGVRLQITMRDTSADSSSNAQIRTSIGGINTTFGSYSGTSTSDEQVPFPQVESPASPTPTNPVVLSFPSFTQQPGDRFGHGVGPERPGSSHGTLTHTPGFAHGHGPSLERRLSVDSLLHGLRHGGLHHSISEQDLRMRARDDMPQPFAHTNLSQLSAQLQSQHLHSASDAKVATDTAHMTAYTDVEPEANITAHPSRVKTPPQYIHARRISNIYHFDSVGKVPVPRTVPRPRSISVSSETDSPVAGRGLLLEDTAAASPAGQVVDLDEGSANLVGMTMGLGLETVQGGGAERVALPPYQGPLPIPIVNAGEEDAYWPRERSESVGDAGATYSPEQYFMAVQQHQSYQAQQQQQAHQPVAQPSVLSSTRRQLGLGLVPRRAHAQGRGNLGLEMTGERERGEGEREAPPERNRIDIGKIERGEETRTTVMIKNIPNKMSDRHLIEFINDVCPRKIDFLYLRMDFTNGCNVGYAFVNFIQVEDLLQFAKTKLGTKWNLFSSEKVLGMSYANYQGKEALIDKFRSSSIMDQRESWRPKIFYSYGPKKGLPEEFPAPTHMRRKERSSLVPSELHQGRAALFHHPTGMRG